MTTPIKRRMISLAEGFGAAQTELSMLKMKLRDAEAAAEGSKRKPRAGMSVAYLGTHILSTEGVHAQLASAEASRAAKKSKRKGKAKQVDGGDPTEDPLFIQSHTDQN